MWFLKRKTRSTEFAKQEPVRTFAYQAELKPDPIQVQKLINDIYFIVKHLDPESDEDKFIPWIRSYEDRNIKIKTNLPSNFKVWLNDGTKVFDYDLCWFEGPFDINCCTTFRPGNWLDHIDELVEKAKIVKREKFSPIND